MEGETDPRVPPLDPEHPSESEAFRYAIDLFNHGYFWECHVYFEALWNAHGRQGYVADFMKGMIKLAAAGIKFKLGQRESAVGHIKRAGELFRNIESQEGKVYLGFNLHELNLKLMALNDSFQIEVHPDWE